MLIGFNTGIHQSIELAERILGDPADVPTTKFGKPAMFSQRIPKRDAFIAGPGLDAAGTNGR